MDASEQKIFDDVTKELRHQVEKWGVQAHSPAMWLIILVEELGEAAKALLEDLNWREELVQIAAVAIAAIKTWDEEVARGGYHCALSLNDNDHTIETKEGE